MTAPIEVPDKEPHDEVMNQAIWGYSGDRVLCFHITGIVG